MRIVDESKIQEKEHVSRWLIGPWNSESKLDFGVAFFQPDQQVKKHVHEKVEEIFYVIEGEIILLLDKDQKFVLKKGQVAYIPPKQGHALQNRSRKIAKLVIVKSPSIPTNKTYLI
ncbi:MAG: cupin domain-containing protein [Candidatus Helarchaeota archaeon]|nr:cupin domain-containing protein [Candidatus Helarchaeota archaeon]